MVLETFVVGLLYLPYDDGHKSGRSSMGGYSTCEVKNIGIALSGKACLCRCPCGLLW